MVRLLTLVRTLLLANLGLNAFRYSRQRRRALLTAVAIVAGLGPLVFGYAKAIGLAYAGLAQQKLALQDLLLAGNYAFAQFAVLFTSMTVSYSTLLRARDLSILLPLPYRPAQIVLAKLAVVWLLELMIGGAFFLPLLAQHLAHTGAGPLRVLAAVPIALTMPVIPLCAAALLVLLVGNLPGLGRNRWFWHCTLMLASLAAWLMLRNVAVGGAPIGDVTTLVQVKMRHLERIGRLLPGSLFAVRALTMSGPAAAGNLLLALASAAAAVGVVLAVANRLYLRPVLDDAGARGRGRAEASRPRAFVISCARKEIACVLRDPAVAMNALGGYVAVPIGVGASLLSQGHGGGGSAGGIRALAAALADPSAAAWRPLAAAGAGLGAAALGMLSSLFSASWSKDGRRLWIERTLPVDPFAVFLGKWMGGMVIASAGHLLAVVAVGLLLRLTPGLWLYAWLVGELALGAGGAFGLAIDALRPKLAWKETVEAVKQNVNVMFGMLACLALLAANGGVMFACVALGLPPALVWAAPLVVNLGAIAAGFALGRGAAERVALLDV